MGGEVKLGLVPVSFCYIFSVGVNISMATHITTGGANAEGTEGGVIDVTKFLADNKLTYVADKFKEKDVSIEELFEFTSEELNEWAASDLGLDTLARKRLIKAVSALKPKTPQEEDLSSLPSHFGNRGAQGGQPAHVIVSPEEHEAISKLYQRFDDTSNLISSLESSFNMLEKSAIDCKTSVNSGFEEIVNELKRKEKSLSEECVIVGNEKKTKLLGQLESLKEYCKVISNGKTKYEEYISDSTMDIHKRKTTIVSMIDDIINNNNVCMVMVTQPKIGFPVNQKQVKFTKTTKRTNKKQKQQEKKRELNKYIVLKNVFGNTTLAHLFLFFVFFFLKMCVFCDFFFFFF